MVTSGYHKTIFPRDYPDLGSDWSLRSTAFVCFSHRSANSASQATRAGLGTPPATSLNGVEEDARFLGVTLVEGTRSVTRLRRLDS